MGTVLLPAGALGGRLVLDVDGRLPDVLIDFSGALLPVIDTDGWPLDVRVDQAAKRLAACLLQLGWCLISRCCLLLAG